VASRQLSTLLLVLTPVLVGVGLYFGIAQQSASETEVTRRSADPSVAPAVVTSGSAGNVAMSGQPNPGTAPGSSFGKSNSAADGAALATGAVPHGPTKTDIEPIVPPTLSSSDSTIAEPSGPASSTTTQNVTTTTVPSLSTASSVTTSSSTSTSSSSQVPSPSSGHNDIEIEIFRLTNAIRANPSGPLARQGPLPDCVGDDFYQIEIDPATGHPKPAPLLTLDETVSMKMARPWSIQMDNSDTMGHRQDQIEFLESIGIMPGVSGENVAWSSGYSQSDAAMVHFTGWRQSDTGHYCAMMAPAYTHVGVGHHMGADKFWATQNFYAPR